MSPRAERDKAFADLKPEDRKLLLDNINGFLQEEDFGFKFDDALAKDPAPYWKLLESVKYKHIWRSGLYMMREIESRLRRLGKAQAPVEGLDGIRTSYNPRRRHCHLGRRRPSLRQACRRRHRPGRRQHLLRRGHAGVDREFRRTEHLQGAGNLAGRGHSGLPRALGPAGRESLRRHRDDTGIRRVRHRHAHQRRRQQHLQGSHVRAGLFPVVWGGASSQSRRAQYLSGRRKVRSQAAAGEGRLHQRHVAGLFDRLPRRQRRHAQPLRRNRTAVDRRELQHLHRRDVLPGRHPTGSPSAAS